MVSDTQGLGVSQSQPVTAQTSLATSGAELTGPDKNGAYRYGQWSIHYDPPPIPVRSCDWQFSHDNFDASYEGPEDGWVGNGLCGHAGSLAEAIAEIDAIEAGRA